MSTNEKGNSVQSIDRAFDIIEELSTNQNGLGLTEISNKIGLSKSTVYRIIKTLTSRGIIEKNDDNSYKIGIKLIEIVSCYINSLELQTEARPFLCDITENLGLTAHLGVLDGSDVVYVEKMDVFSGVKLYSQIGFRVPAYCSSLGKCLLANYSSHDVENILKGCKFKKYTKNTITNMEDLKKHFTRVRQCGWAMDNEEYNIGHRCIGAPIYDYRGEIIAAVSASGSTVILTEDKIKPTVDYVKNTAMKISRRLGYTI